MLAVRDICGADVDSGIAIPGKQPGSEDSISRDSMYQTQYILTSEIDISHYIGLGFPKSWSEMSHQLILASWLMQGRGTREKKKEYGDARQSAADVSRTVRPSPYIRPSTFARDIYCQVKRKCFTTRLGVRTCWHDPVKLWQNGVT